jgi:hypothetical protein
MFQQRSGRRGAKKNPGVAVRVLLWGAAKEGAMHHAALDGVAPSHSKPFPFFSFLLQEVYNTNTGKVCRSG